MEEDEAAGQVVCGEGGGGAWHAESAGRSPNPVPISKDHLLTYNVI